MFKRLRLTVLFLSFFSVLTFSQPVLLNPADGSYGLPTSFEFTWAEEVGATAYRLQISTASDFSTTVFNSNIGNVTSYTPGLVFDNYTVYYWRVRSNVSPGSNFSAPWSFRTIDSDPSAASDLNPDGGIQFITATPALSWTASVSNTPVTYTVTVKDASNATVFTTNTTDVSVVSDPLEGGVYTWTVTAVNETANEIISAAAEFEVLAPVLTYPNHAATGLPLTPTFVWEAVDGAESYELQVDDNSDFSSPEFEETGIVNLFKDLPGSLLSNNIKYYWRVRAYAGGEAGAFSSRNFRTSTTGNGGLNQPVLSVPVDGAEVYTTSPDLFWYVNGGAGSITDYEIQYSLTDNFESADTLPVTLTSTGLTVQAADLIPATEYFWRVRGYSSTLDLYSAYSETESFVISPTLGPVTPIQSYPIGGTTVYSNAPTLFWYTGAAPAGLKYDIEYNTTGTFTGTPTAADIEDMFYELTGLTAGAEYFWKVRATLDGDPSAWSDAESFIVDESTSGAPVKPVISWPLNDAVVYSSTPTLFWYLESYVSGLRYTVQITKASEAFSAGEIILLNAGELSTVVSELEGGEEYKWRVRSRKPGFTASDWSDIAYFSVDAASAGAPVVPYASWPVGGATVYTDTVHLFWYTSGGSASLEYDYRYATSESGLEAAGITGTTEMTAALTGLSAGTEYFWQVRSRNSTSESDWSEIANFVTKEGTSSGLAVPTLSWPTGGATVYTTDPTLFWYLLSYTGVTGYEIEISANPDMSDSETFVSTAAEYEIEGLVPGTTYFWRVRSSDGVDQSMWSDIEEFTIAPGSAPVVPAAASPAHGVQIATNSPVLSWYLPVSASGLKYEIQVSANADFSDAVTVNGLSSLNYQVENLAPGVKYYWRVRSENTQGVKSAYSFRGVFTANGITDVNENSIIPAVFTVDQNYPNPFNPNTTIKFGLPEAAHVTVKIYDMLGREVKTLLNGAKSAGTYSIIWDGDNNAGAKVSSGNYIYKVTAGENIKIKKMTLIK